MVQGNRLPWPNVDGVRRFGVSTAATVVQLETTWDGQSPWAGGRRGRVDGFSDKSRRNLLRTMCALTFMDDEPWEITLTWPGEFPLDGRRVKRDLAAFWRRLERRYGRLQAVWKLEFQGRGAPHFHLAVSRPVASLSEVRAFVSAAWFEVVGSGDLRHLGAGTQVIKLEYSPAAYFAGYLGGTRTAKEYQHRVPEGFESVGRFWGLRNVSPEWNQLRLTEAEFFALRRLVRKWVRANLGRQRVSTASRVQGEWYGLGEGKSGTLVLAQLLRALPGRDGVAPLRGGVVEEEEMANA